jgi:hypothetical protein
MQDYHWSFTHNTILENVVCDYVYYDFDRISGKFFERRPSNLSQNFAQGEFSKLLKMDYLQEDKYHYRIEIRQEFRSAFKQYLTYFEEFVRKAKGKKIKFEVHTEPNGLEILIDSDNEEETVKIVRYLKEYVSLITQNIDNLNIEIQSGVSSLQAETLIVDLRHQLRHLQGSLDNARLEIKYQKREICNLKTQVEQYYTLLLETKTKGDFIQQNIQQNNYQGQGQQQESKMTNNQSQNNVNQPIANTGEMESAIASGNNTNINQVQDPQLKELLEQLKSEINSSELKEEDKEDALEEVENIAEAQKKQDGKALQKAGRSLKRIISNVPEVTKGVKRIDELWNQIQQLDWIV